MVMLYLGPDTTLPVMSAVATGFGLLLLFWHKSVGIARSVFRSLFRRK
jgi:hypothetical protein